MRSAEYMPILKGKQGELLMLREMGRREGVHPLVEVPRITWDFDSESPAHSVEEHTARFLRRFEKTMSQLGGCAVDAHLLEVDGSAESTYALGEILARGADIGCPATPATGLGRSRDYNRVAGRHARKWATGCVVRVEREDLYDTPGLKAELEDLLGDLRLTPGDVDLVADMKMLREEQEGSDLEFLIDVLPQLPYLKAWRSFWFAGGSFPEFLTGIAPESTVYIPRLEWTIWNGLTRGLRGSRVPKFADYGIAHPISPDVNTRTMNMSANIRYTAEDHWIVLKGRSTRTHGYGQFNDLCRRLGAATEFCGRHFSHGDRYFDDCARGADGPGQATKWRQAGSSHHVEFVSVQVEKANRSGRVT